MASWRALRLQCGTRASKTPDGADAHRLHPLTMLADRRTRRKMRRDDSEALTRPVCPSQSYMHRCNYPPEHHPRGGKTCTGDARFQRCTSSTTSSPQTGNVKSPTNSTTASSMSASSSVPRWASKASSSPPGTSADLTRGKVRILSLHPANGSLYLSADSKATSDRFAAENRLGAAQLRRKGCLVVSCTKMCGPRQYEVHRISHRRGESLHSGRTCCRH